MTWPCAAANRAELAELFGVSLPTVDAWVRDGCPFAEKGAKGREWAFATADVHRWLVDRAVADVAAGYAGEIGVITTDEARRRKAVADAVVAEIKADEALNEVVNRHEAAADVAGFRISLRTGLSNAVAKIAGRAAAMTGAPDIQALAETEINRAFDAARDELGRKWGTVAGSVADAGQDDEPRD